MENLNFENWWFIIAIAAFDGFILILKFVAFIFAARGYFNHKTNSWLFFMIFSFLFWIKDIPNIINKFLLRTVSINEYAQFMNIFYIINVILSIALVIILILAFYCLLKDYKKMEAKQ